MQDIYFHLPGIFEHFNFYTIFLQFYVNEREKFHDWAQIGSIYGSPHECIWNGGRLKFFTSPLEEEVVDFIKDYDLSCRFTFTNPFIDDKLVYDSFCNMILRKFNWEGHKNTIIINSPILEDYIRKEYPTYKLISSTTKCITNDKEALEEVSKDYVMTVLDYNYNKNMEFLKTVSNPEKVELLVNPVCVPNCPRRKAHYEAIAKGVLHESREPFECDYQGRLFYEAMESLLFISIEDIQNIYEPLGFRNYKLEGRTAGGTDLIEMLIYYLVKPEYQREMRQKILAILVP